MTGPTSDTVDPAAPAARAMDLVLAHLHLRLGSLALARAELETLAGRDTLDDAGLIDLAEARWRTGDVAGAGEAAAAVLGEGDDGPLIALVVAAEAALTRGRPSEARRYATRAMEVAAGGIDAAFAGMPRGPIWPADATTLTQPAPTLFDTSAAVGRGTGAASIARSEAVAEMTAAAAAAAAIDALAPGQVHGALSPEPATLAIWEAFEPASATDGSAAVPPMSAADPAATSEPDLPAGDDALDLGRSALEMGDLAAAAVHLALAIRLTPALAPAVLDAIHGRSDRELAFVRGDAYRLVGHEREARRAFADAMRPVAPYAPLTDPPPEGDSA